MGTAAAVVAGGVLLSRIIGLIREQVAAAILGGTATGDVYQAAFTIADWINYLLAGGFMAITFIPILSRYLAADDEEGGWDAFTAIARPVGLAMVVLVALAMAVAEPVLDLVYPRFEGDQLAEAARLTRIVLPAQFFFILGSLLMAVQYAKGQFVVPTLAPIIYNVGIIAGGIAFNLGREAPTPEGFAWGVLGGAVVGNFLVQVWGAHRVGLRVRWSLPWAHPVISEYLLLAIPLMVGQSIVVLDEQFMKSFGNLVSDGAVVQLQVARRTMLVPVGVIAQAAGVAAYPFLARLFAEDKHREMAATVARALRYVIALSIAASALLAALTLPSIRALFERGNFLPEHSEAAAAALFFYALAIPVWGALQLITRGFYARREMWVPVVAGTAVTVLAFPLYWALQAGFGIRGVAFASTLALLAYTATLAVIWYRRTGTEFLWPVVNTTARALPLAAVAGVAAWLAGGITGSVVAADSFVGSVAAIVAGTAAFGVVVFAGGAGLHSLTVRVASSTQAADDS